VGYKRAKTIKLSWADGEFGGLEIRMRRVSIEELWELAPFLDTVEASAEDVEMQRELVSTLGGYLVSWNLEDEDTGEPVPCTPASLAKQDLPFMQEIVTGFMRHIAGVPAPLEQPSPDGEPSPEASLPMEPLSPSPES
jgi:hypothetical protein